jgi:hypothetical protein
MSCAAAEKGVKPRQLLSRKGPPPMSISLYQASVPVFLRAFENLSAILEKGVEHANDAKLDPSALTEARLFENMYPLPGQIQRASDTAKGFVARVAGIDSPKYEDNEKTFAEMQARIQKTVEFIKSVKPEQIDGGIDREISIFSGSRGEMKFKGRDYLLNYALPNFFFHVVTAYDILRHKGVPLTKKNYLGSMK